MDAKLEHWFEIMRWARSIGCCPSCSQWLAFSVVDGTEYVDAKGNKILHCTQPPSREKCADLWRAEWKERPLLTGRMAA